MTQTERFKPFRRRVRYLKAQEAPIAPLLDQLSFARGGRHWGLTLRRGTFEIEQADYLIIAAAMNVTAP